MKQTSTYGVEVRRLDHENSSLQPATDGTSLTLEQVKQKALRGELGSTEMPAAQVWDAPGVTVAPHQTFPHQPPMPGKDRP